MNKTKIRPGSRPALLRAKGFTLLELLVATACATLLAAAILASVVGLRKSFVATQQYAESQAAQVRLLDYVARDLRKLTGTGNLISPAISTGSFTSIGSVNHPDALVTAASTASGTLTLVIPGYYSSTQGATPNVFVYQSGTMGYGTVASGPAITTSTVSYFKCPQNYSNPSTGYDSYWRYVRVESMGSTSGTSVIVDKADGTLLDILQSGTGVPAAYTVRVRFNPSFKFSKTGPPSEPAAAAGVALASGSYVTASEYVLLRGTN